MNHLPNKVSKYLNKYSFGNWKLAIRETNRYENIVVIPAIGEFENLNKLLNSLSKCNSKYFDRTLIIFVINNMYSSSDEVKKDNQKSIKLLKSIINRNQDEEYKDIVNSGLKINFIDASSKGNELPDKEGGVGLARKIGMDLALNLFDYNSPSKKLLICLDADCTVSDNYLNEIIDSFNKNNYSAAVVNYEHQLNENDDNIYAIICYEIFLRYYVLGLIYSGSPYAIHTVGSTMICDFESYIKIEGMNKKKAAEDFYFLEKLAKHYKIQYIKTTTVYPSSRSSWRVPFGTGQRVGRFLKGTQNEYLLYDPASFIVLKKWLNLLINNQNISSESLLNKTKEINSELYNFLINQNFQHSWDNILNHSKNDAQLILQKKRWFDGFRTLKLIHHLRDTEFPLINMFDALDKMFHNFDKPDLPKRESKEIPNLQIQKEYLKILRELT